MCSLFIRENGACLGLLRGGKADDVKV
jgi:hypothetical protein